MKVPYTKLLILAGTIYQCIGFAIIMVAFKSLRHWETSYWQSSPYFFLFQTLFCIYVLGLLFIFTYICEIPIRQSLTNTSAKKSYKNNIKNILVFQIKKKTNTTLINKLHTNKVNTPLSTGSFTLNNVYVSKQIQLL